LRALRKKNQKKKKKNFLKKKKKHTKKMSSGFPTPKIKKRRVEPKVAVERKRRHKCWADALYWMDARTVPREKIAG